MSEERIGQPPVAIPPPPEVCSEASHADTFVNLTSPPGVGSIAEIPAQLTADQTEYYDAELAKRDARIRELEAELERRTDEYNELQIAFHGLVKEIGRLHADANHNHVTGLPNRVALFDHLDRLVETAPGSVAVVFIDISGLKELNDAAGHNAGNALLRYVAQYLRDDPDLYHIHKTHPHGDEFVLVIRLEKSEPETEKPAESKKTLVDFERRKKNLTADGMPEFAQSLANRLANADPPINCTMGWAIHTPGELSHETLHRADVAANVNKMYKRLEHLSDDDLVRNMELLKELTERNISPRRAASDLEAVRAIFDTIPRLIGTPRAERNDSILQALWRAALAVS